MRRNLVVSLVMAIVLTVSAAVPGWAGAINGPREGDYRLSANSYQPFYISFRGNARASVYVIGDGTTNLDLYIYDSFGRLVAVDDDAGDECLAIWYPTYSQVYRVVVLNRGLVYNDYRIQTN